ncbi:MULTISPECIES: tyrosine-type recombinase/integrase [unclassified Pseudomonas]|jgi:integrase|uniref:tyrosine-type recombinase/integrase n=1 Tax=unclassified Pseudomonas TaxID=196821 RepID=UPI001F44E167|nr:MULTISPECIES: tyrosine-type recombinase/integrase [unclassified Pseudomonas]
MVAALKAGPTQSPKHLQMLLATHATPMQEAYRFISNKKTSQEKIDKRISADPFLINLRLHDLRHKATSRLAEIFPLHELTKIMEHQDARTLMRYYHPKIEDLARKLS